MIMKPKTSNKPNEDKENGAVAADPIFLTQLWSDQFRHFTTLGVAGGTAIILFL